MDRDARRRLLIKARQYWHNATLICITHDVSETLNFPRVLVIEDGRIIEDADPHSLAQDAGTRYYALLEAEQAVRRGLWSSSEWKRWYVDSGKVEPGELPTPDVEL